MGGYAQQGDGRRTRRGWQATASKLDAVLRHLNAAHAEAWLTALQHLPMAKATTCGAVQGGQIWYNTPVATRSVIGGIVRVADGRRTIDCGLLPPHHQPGDRIMPRVKFGAFLAPHHPIGEHPMLQFRRDLDLVEHLDKLGYDEFWCGEHHSSGWEMIASPEMFLAAAGERSTRSSAKPPL